MFRCLCSLLVGFILTSVTTVWTTLSVRASTHDTGVPNASYMDVYEHSYYFIDGLGDAKPFLKSDQKQLLEQYGFRSLQGVSVNFGYEHRVHWFYIPLQAFSIGEDSLLRFNYPLVDYLDLYQKWPGGDWQLTHKTGDMRPFDSRKIENRVYLFPISKNADALLLRIQTEGSLVAPLAIVNPAYQRVQENITTWTHGLFFGALGIMCFYNLFVYVFTRDSGFFYYVGTLFFILIYLLAMSGYGYQWIWRENGQWVNEHIQPITVGMVLACVCRFSESVLRLKVYLPGFARWVDILAKVSFAVALVGFFAPLRVLIHFISFLPVAVIGLVIISGLFALRAKVSGAGFFLFAWSGSLLGALLFTLHQLGVLPSHPLFVHSLKIGVLLNTVFLSFSLVAHINLLKKEKQKAEEMANENYRLALVDSLTGIPNRRAFDHNYRLEYRRSQREKTPLSVLMVDVDYFKRYNDDNGHNQGDIALRKVASCLIESLSRPADSAFRYGGEEFVILLPDTDSTGAVHLAETILKRVAAAKVPHGTSPFRNLTVSIGVATERMFENDQLALLERADEALYLAKSEGRNQYKLSKSPSSFRVLTSPKSQ